jgi:hypothetical protein
MQLDTTAWRISVIEPLAGKDGNAETDRTSMVALREASGQGCD